MSFMSDIASRLESAIGSMRAEGQELLRTADSLEAAYSGWDLETIAQILQLNEREVETLREELDATEMDEEDW